MEVVFICDKCSSKLIVDYTPTCEQAVCPVCGRTIQLRSLEMGTNSLAKEGAIRLQTLGVTYMAELDEHRFSSETERRKLLSKVDKVFRNKYGSLLRGDSKGTVNKETTLVSLQYITKYAKPELMNEMGSFLDQLFRPYKKTV